MLAQEALETSRIHSAGTTFTISPLSVAVRFPSPAPQYFEAGHRRWNHAAPWRSLPCAQWVLFLDEAGGEVRATLDALRQPLKTDMPPSQRERLIGCLPPAFMLEGRDPCPRGWLAIGPRGCLQCRAGAAVSRTDYRTAPWTALDLQIEVPDSRFVLPRR